MARILVVYYSRSGNTAKVARGITGICGADCEEIRDSAVRSGLVGWFLSGREAWLGRAAPIEPPSCDPQEYDLVVVGSPLWAGRLSSPVRSYLQGQRGRIPQVAAFITRGGTNPRKAFEEIERLAGKAPVATLTLTERELGRGAHDRIGAFADSIVALLGGEKVQPIR